MYQPPSFSLQWIVARSSMHCTNQEIALTSYFLTHCFALNSSHNYNKKKNTTLLVSWEAVSFFFSQLESRCFQWLRLGKTSRFSENIEIFGNTSRGDSRKTSRFSEAQVNEILGKQRHFRKHIAIFENTSRFSENFAIFGNTSRFSETHRHSRKRIEILGKHRHFRDNKTNCLSRDQQSNV